MANRRLPTFLFLSMVLCFTRALHSDDDPKQVYGKSAPGIVFIKTDTGAGTGFLVSADGTIVTARHVIDGATKVAVKTQSSDIYDDVLLIAEDERRDIAILKINGFDMPFLPLGNSNEVKPGDHVLVIGNPLGAEELKTSISDGIVSGIRDFDAGYKTFQLTAPVSPGNSGGPALNDAGQVIGVIVFRLREGENLNFAVPINYVRGLLGSNGNTQASKHWKKAEGSADLFSERAALKSDKWRSTKTGAVFSVRIQNEYFYAERQEPSEALKLGLFQTLESKKQGDKYVGTIHTAYVHWRTNPYNGEKVVNRRCTLDIPVELTVISPDRIEGRQLVPPDGAKFNDRTCKFSRASEWQSFVLIPE